MCDTSFDKYRWRGNLPRCRNAARDCAIVADSSARIDVLLPLAFRSCNALH
jgi:hypothetical protein